MRLQLALNVSDLDKTGDSEQFSNIVLSDGPADGGSCATSSGTCCS